MEITGVHILLTLRCIYECDHCFLYCTPGRTPTFSIGQMESAFKQMREISTLKWVYFEGGEPFLYYPILHWGVQTARSMGYRVGIVTNGYWATEEKDIRLWLKPLAKLGIDDLSVSSDELHDGENARQKEAMFRAACKGLPLEPEFIRIECHYNSDEPDQGDTRFRGRAADKLTTDAPRFPADSFRECVHEKLENPSRLHIDPEGNVHICQGVVVGNIFKQTLKEISDQYDPGKHPIVAPLIDGGPYALAKETGLDISAEGYADSCHLCYEARRSVIDPRSDYLAPRCVYGLDD